MKFFLKNFVDSDEIYNFAVRVGTLACKNHALNNTTNCPLSSLSANKYSNIQQ